MDKLLPCPFCGGDASIESMKNFVLCCAKCEAYITFGENECIATKGQVVSKWNRRAQPPNEPLTVDELKKMHDMPVYVQIIDASQFADKEDAINGWAMVRLSWARLWDASRADIVKIDHDFEDYGKTWLAYRHRPEGNIS
ncbi:Lar family restriction alleviation protein [Eubacteriales bacterium OttesenSCG-928-K08]|nr:Lar family restriction alleviation protein [Eubacteriales bacterium OttesenSCG-928-K08]